MVERLYIKNFQSHKETDIKLVPGVNVIVGSTDSGKSAIIRALKMAVLNRPSGDAMRSWWGGETSVLMELQEGNILERVKNGGEIYRLNEMEFKAFRTNVPDEIVTAVNMDEENFQNQVDAPFLLSATSGEVASFFNRIAKIDKIDSSLKAVQSWLRALTQKREFKKETLSEKEQELAGYAYIDELEDKVDALEEMDKRVIQLARQQRELQKEVERWKELQENIQNLAQLLQAGAQVDKMLEMFAELKHINATYDTLDGLYCQQDQVKKLIKAKSAVLKAERGVGMVLALMEERNAVRTNEKAISEQITGYSLTSERLKTQNALVLSYKKEFDLNFPNTCPLCGTSKKKIK
jgi:DNA repair protein SbcC/Rad50